MTTKTINTNEQLINLIKTIAPGVKYNKDEQDNICRVAACASYGAILKDGATKALYSKLHGMFMDAGAEGGQSAVKLIRFFDTARHTLMYEPHTLQGPDFTITFDRGSFTIN